MTFQVFQKDDFRNAFDENENQPAEETTESRISQFEGLKVSKITVFELKTKDHRMIVEDCFAPVPIYNDSNFHRMRHNLFLNIVNKVKDTDYYFVRKKRCRKAACLQPRFS
ncbi:hypothetical protein BY458DRAFT_548458 [Sporodiniella umbellata]|nr:hypothetical protein BY458DRAFT_548458 [Sporodiniella umbellata]